MCLPVACLGADYVTRASFPPPPPRSTTSTTGGMKGPPQQLRPRPEQRCSPEGGRCAAMPSRRGPSDLEGLDVGQGERRRPLSTPRLCGSSLGFDDSMGVTRVFIEVEISTGPTTTLATDKKIRKEVGMKRSGCDAFSLQWENISEAIDQAAASGFICARAALKKKTISAVAPRQMREASI